MLKERFYYSLPMAIATVEQLVINGNRFITERELKREPLPRITICGIWDTDTNEMYFGTTCCSSKDRFEKRIGRNIARHRAINCPDKTVSIGTKSVPEVFMENARQLEIEVMSSDKYKRNGS